MRHLEEDLRSEAMVIALECIDRALARGDVSRLEAFVGLTVMRRVSDVGRRDLPIQNPRRMRKRLKRVSFEAIEEEVYGGNYFNTLVNHR
jgi:hypothetical protein